MTYLVERLAQLPGLRNVVVHEHVRVDFDRIVEAVNDLAPIEEFDAILRRVAAATSRTRGTPAADTWKTALWNPPR